MCLSSLRERDMIDRIVNQIKKPLQLEIYAIVSIYKKLQLR